MFNNQKIIATIEARMTSSRLPGKVLMPLAGEPALKQMIDRVKKSKYLDEVVVATTVNASDNLIVELLEKINCKYFRGSEMDVMGRVVGAAKSVNADIIVELTADCPLMDPALIDRGIEEFFSGDFDCAANVIERSYPDGFDVQTFPARLLDEAAKLTNDPIDREHVSRYFYQHPEKYKILHWQAPKEFYWPELRVTLDEMDDYILINKIFEEFHFNDKKDFDFKDVINLCRRFSELTKINQHVQAKQV